MADFAELNQQINVSLNDKNASAGYKRISDSAEKARIAAKTAVHEMTRGFDAASMAALDRLLDRHQIHSTRNCHGLVKLHRSNPQSLVVSKK